MLQTFCTTHISSQHKGVISIFYLKHIGGESGHYEIYYGNTFLCSADTIREAWNELLSIREEYV